MDNFSKYKVCVCVCVCVCVPGTGLLGPPAAVDSLSTFDILSQTSSASSLEPNKTRDVIHY